MSSRKPPARRDEPSRRAHAAVLAAVAVAVTLAYADSFDAGFVLDSAALVLENPAVKTASSANVRFLLTHDYWQPMATGGLYRPATMLSFLANYALLGSGNRPLGYHLTNLLLHLGCVALVYALVWQLVRRRSPAGVAAALFGLHPIGTEAVTYVAGRADLLASLGVLAGVVCHARATAAPGRKPTVWSAALFAAALLAFFSKESGLVLVAAVIAHDLLLAPRSGARRVTVEHALLLVALAAYAALRWAAARSGPPPPPLSPIDNPIAEAGFWTGRLTALKVLVLEAALLVWPQTPSADYSFRQIPVVAWPPARWDDALPFVALAGLALAAGGALRLRRREPALVFLVVLAGLAWLPTANLLVAIGSIRADRFLYLPLVGLAGALAVAAARIGSRRPAAGVLAAVVLVALGARTWVRNRDWHDDRTLWTSAVAASPASAKAHEGLATALFAADPSHATIAATIAEAERAVAIRPDYFDALVNLGGDYVVQGDLLAAGEGGATAARPWFIRAAEVLERARRLDARGTVDLFNNLSLAYARLERLDAALDAYEATRRLDPGNPNRYLDVAAMLYRLGRWEDASVAIFQAMAIDRNDPDIARRLVDLYRAADPSGHAVVADGADRLRLNVDDPLVRRHRCRAYVGLAGIYAEAGLPDAAARARTDAARLCPAP